MRAKLAKSQRLLEVVSRNMAEEAVGLVQDGFRSETDPYGERWKPKQNPDGRKTLSGVTGRLKTGWHLKTQDAKGFTVAPSVEYALYHQAPRRGRSGRLKRPRRRMVPVTRQGMPRKWSRRLNEAAREAFQAMESGKLK